jgi:hypothetical protein
MEFHTRSPGALAAQFILAVMEKMNLGAPQNERELYKVDVERWCRDYANLKEVRDQREVATLTAILKRLGSDRIPEAADIIAQRIKSVLLAKGKNGSWDKSGIIELISPQDSQVTLASEFALTGLPS